MSVKLLIEHHLELLGLNVGYTGSSESTLVKVPHCWKSHVTAQSMLHVYLCYALVCFLQSCDCLLGNCWPIGPLVRCVFLVAKRKRVIMIRLYHNHTM